VWRNQNQVHSSVTKVKLYSYFHFGLHTSTPHGAAAHSQDYILCVCVHALFSLAKRHIQIDFCQTPAICKQLARESIENYHQNSQHALVRCWLSDFAENARGSCAHYINIKCCALRLSGETKAPAKSVCMQKSFDRRHCLICELLYKICHAIKNYLSCARTFCKKTLGLFDYTSRILMHIKFKILNWTLNALKGIAVIPFTNGQQTIILQIKSKQLELNGFRIAYF
jgi:hypothetical protein